MLSFGSDFTLTGHKLEPRRGLVRVILISHGRHPPRACSPRLTSRLLSIEAVVRNMLRRRRRREEFSGATWVHLPTIKTLSLASSAMVRLSTSRLKIQLTWVYLRLASRAGVAACVTQSHSSRRFCRGRDIISSLCLC